MKTQLAISTFALIVGLSGMTSAVAESFNDRGLDWTKDSPMPNAVYTSKPQTLPPDGSFASSWGSGKTPTQYEGPSLSPPRLTTGENCSLSPRFGFNDITNLPTCSIMNCNGRIVVIQIGRTKSYPSRMAESAGTA